MNSRQLSGYLGAAFLAFASLSAFAEPPRYIRYYDERTGDYYYVLEEEISDKRQDTRREEPARKSNIETKGSSGETKTFKDDSGKKVKAKAEKEFVPAPPEENQAAEKGARTGEWLRYGEAQREHAAAVDQGKPVPWLIFITSKGKCAACRDIERALADDRQADRNGNTVSEKLKGMVLSRVFDDVYEDQAAYRTLHAYMKEKGLINQNGEDGAPTLLLIDGGDTRLVLGGIDTSNMHRLLNDEVLIPRPFCEPRYPDPHLGDPGQKHLRSKYQKKAKQSVQREYRGE